MDEEGNPGYYLYNEATGEEKLFSVVKEEERMYFLGEHKGKFGKGGTAAGVVFTGEDVLKQGKRARLNYGPNPNRNKFYDYFNTAGSQVQDNVFNNVGRELRRKGVDYYHASPVIEKAKHDAFISMRKPREIAKAVKKQKFNRSSVGKLLKKVKIR